MEVPTDAHHRAFHEGHQAPLARIGPGVPIPQLHHNIPGPHDMYTVVQQQNALSFEQDAIIHRFRFVYRRGKCIGTPFVPGAPVPTSRLMQRNRSAVGGRIITLGLGG